MKLAITPLLRPLMPEHLADVVEPLRLLRHEIVLDGGAHAASGTLGAQRQRFAVESIDKEFFGDPLAAQRHGLLAVS
jgi:hypothetical protein